jgi:MFS transporter, PCFT/HCP family, solute carrier family 46, member 3
MNSTKSMTKKASDYRPCMLIPIVGELFTAIGLIFCTYFEYWPMEVAGVTEALFPGLAGN